MLDLVVVSAFGRGQWLASELRIRGLKVALVDVSHHLGRWTPDDWEGPFGFFSSDQLSASQQARMTEGDHLESVDQGFTLWLNDGPIDLKGPLSQHLLKHSGLSEEALRYLSSYENLSSSERADLREALESQSFDQSWLVHLAHQGASHCYRSNSHGLGYGKPLPIYAPYFAHRVSRRGSESALEVLRQKGVVIYEKAQLKDLTFDKKTCLGLEVKSDWSGVLRGEQYVWMLSSEETHYLSSAVSQPLFPRGILKPLWCWMRYRVRVGETPTYESLPLRFVMISDKGLPWTHNNFCWVQKAVGPSDLDVWVRLPCQQRFQRAYLDQVGQEILQLFRSRLPHSEPEVLNKPQDDEYDYTQLGPSRFPVFEEGDLRRWSPGNFQNLYFDSPEYWTNLDWTGQFEHQSVLVEKISQKYQALRTKRESSIDQPLHP